MAIVCASLPGLDESQPFLRPIKELFCIVTCDVNFLPFEFQAPGFSNDRLVWLIFLPFELQHLTDDFFIWTFLLLFYSVTKCINHPSVRFNRVWLSVSAGTLWRKSAYCLECLGKKLWDLIWIIKVEESMTVTLILFLILWATEKNFCTTEVNRTECIKAQSWYAIVCLTKICIENNSPLQIME